MHCQFEQPKKQLLTNNINLKITIYALIKTDIIMPFWEGKALFTISENKSIATFMFSPFQVNSKGSKLELRDSQLKSPGCYCIACTWWPITVCVTPPLGIWHPFLTSVGTRHEHVQIHMQAKIYIHTQNESKWEQTSEYIKTNCYKFPTRENTAWEHSSI